MRRAGLILCVTALVVPVTRAGASPTARSRSFFLVSVSQLGTVRWHCDTDKGGEGLAFTAFGGGATEQVVFKAAGARRRSLTLQPGETAHFPTLPTRTQQISIVQGTKVGVLRALITAYFRLRLDYCFSYWPPSTDVRFIRQ